MLSENKIDSLIQPLLDRQNRIECTVMSAIAKRLKEVKLMLPSDIYKLQQLYRTGSDAQQINKKISELAEMSEQDIKNIVREVAQDYYKDAKPFYDYSQQAYISYEENIELQTAVQAIERVTLGDYTNLSNSTAFILRDTANPLIIRPTPVSQTYQEVIDRAIQSVTLGAESYNTQIPNAIRDLVSRGITAVDYITDKGIPHRVRLDTVVRRNILDGIRNIGQAVQDVVGEQFGSDGVEISVHQYSAPDHEPIQGHQFTNEEYDKLQTGQEFEDVNGIKFQGIDRPIGMWNCRHFARSIIIGQATPNYTSEELEEIKRKNADGIAVKGKDGKEATKSMYWCTQKQRQYELYMRQAKEGKAMAEIAGEDALKEEYQARVTQLQDEYKAFCQECGLQTRFDKTRIYIGT